MGDLIERRYLMLRLGRGGLIGRRKLMSRARGNVVRRLYLALAEAQTLGREERQALKERQRDKWQRDVQRDPVQEHKQRRG